MLFSFNAANFVIQIRLSDHCTPSPIDNHPNNHHDYDDVDLSHLPTNDFGLSVNRHSNFLGKIRRHFSYYVYVPKTHPPQYQVEPSQTEYKSEPAKGSAYQPQPHQDGPLPPSDSFQSEFIPVSEENIEQEENVTPG